MRKHLPKLAECKHRDMYPEQYRHPLVGVMVDVMRNNDDEPLATGVVNRVVASRHGHRVILKGDYIAYRVEDCRPAHSS